MKNNKTLSTQEMSDIYVKRMERMFKKMSRHLWGKIFTSDPTDAMDARDLWGHALDMIALRHVIEKTKKVDK